MAERRPGESLNQALRFLGDGRFVRRDEHGRFREKTEGASISSGAMQRDQQGRVVDKGATSRRASSRTGVGGFTIREKLDVRLEPGVIDRLADKLDVTELVILEVSGISARTFHRRQQKQEPLAPEEADRVLRIARVAGEAERVFGDGEKSRRWLAREHAVLGAAPLSLLATDAGSRDVEAELMRIDWGDFA